MQYATFMLNKYMFGIPIFLVQEFSRAMPIYPVIGHDKRIAGLLNIRGKISVVIDVKRCLGLEEDEVEVALNGKQFRSKKMIMLETDDAIPSEAKKLGVVGYDEPLVLLVDRIQKVLTIETENYYPPPAHVNEHYVDGVVKHNDTLLTILSISNLTEDLAQDPEPTSIVIN